jgi:hypothetical protein
MSKIKFYVYEELLTRYERATSLARLRAKRSMPIAVYYDDLKNVFLSQKCNYNQCEGIQIKHGLILTGTCLLA